MSALLPSLLLRHQQLPSAAAAAAPSILQACSIRCSSSQATFLVKNGCQAPPVQQMQQLHTYVRAAAARTPAVAGHQRRAGVATLSSPASSSSQLQPIQQPASGTLSSVLTGLDSTQMAAGQPQQHIGLYYDFHRQLVPEAFKPFHQAFYSPRPAKQQREGGCRSLQAEFVLTHSSSLMWRRATQELLHALSSGAVPRVHLQGAGGAGKSIAVVQMVEWARSNGWVVLYVPSAVDLTRGGFFYKRPVDSSSPLSSSPNDTYDTIISAQHILKSMADSHAADLLKLQLQLDGSKQLLGSGAPAAAAAATASVSSDGDVVVAGGEEQEQEAKQQQQQARKKGKKGSAAGAAAAADGTLMQLVVAGLSTDNDGMLAVECCLALIRELAAVSSTQPVLLAVDDYNALYWRTDYGKTLFREPEDGPAYSVRKAIRVDQLNLARNMRLLTRSDLGACRVLVADSSSNRVPGAVNVPSGGAAVYHMPRFSEIETAHALHYYHERGLTAQPPSAHQVAAMRALTNGSGTDLRKWCLKVTQTDMGLL